MWKESAVSPGAVIISRTSSVMMLLCIRNRSGSSYVLVWSKLCSFNPMTPDVAHIPLALFGYSTLQHCHMYIYFVSWLHWRNNTCCVKNSNPGCHFQVHYMEPFQTHFCGIQHDVCAIFGNTGTLTRILNEFLQIWAKLGHATWLWLMDWKG